MPAEAATAACWPPVAIVVRSSQHNLGQTSFGGVFRLRTSLPKTFNWIPKLSDLNGFELDLFCASFGGLETLV